MGLSHVSHIENFHFFFSGLQTSSMNGFCKTWKWLVFLPLKSQFTQCGRSQVAHRKLKTFQLPMGRLKGLYHKPCQYFIHFQGLGSSQLADYLANEVNQGSYYGIVNLTLICNLPENLISWTSSSSLGRAGRSYQISSIGF